jgi:hypothetical protein
MLMILKNPRLLFGTIFLFSYLFIYVVRFSNGKKPTTQGKDKAYIGEVKIELRASERQVYNSPKKYIVASFFSRIPLTF